MFGLRAFIVIEEIGPPHLRDLMFQRKFRSTLIDQPPRRDRGIHQLLAARSGLTMRHPENGSQRPSI